MKFLNLNAKIMLNSIDTNTHDILGDLKKIQRYWQEHLKKVTPDNAHYNEWCADVQKFAETLHGPNTLELPAPPPIQPYNPLIYGPANKRKMSAFEMMGITIKPK